MSIELNRLHHPVTALGPGVRAGIWTQGCSIGCRGCLSRDTWESRPEARRDPAEVIAWLDRLPAAELTGVTISGGEPFDQPAGLLELLLELDAWRAGRGELDLLCYSGYPWRRLRRRHPEALALLDAVISGPYREDLPTDLAWRGSANQELVALTRLGRERYSGDDRRREPAPPIQVSVEPGAIWLIGVPRRGDIAAVESSLAAAGVELGEASWRP